MPWGLFILLGAGLLVGWLLLVAYTVVLLTRPPRKSYAFAVSRSLPGDPSELVIQGRGERGLEYSAWTFRSRGRDLPVWDIRGLKPDGPVIVLTHGWGESRVLALARVAGLAQLARRLVVWDLPAHGDAPAGGFSLGAREHVDLLALLSELHEPNVVLYGWSLGAGVSILAARALGEPDSNPRGAKGPRPLAAIAEAPYRFPITPARNVLHMRGLPHRSNLAMALALVGLRYGHGLWWFGASPTFDRARRAEELDPELPVLVLHGEQDTISPPEDGRAIAESARGGTYTLIPGGRHDDLWSIPAHAAVCVEAVGSLLRSRAAPSV